MSVAEFGGGDEEEAIGADEGGVGLMLKSQKSGEAKPAIGDGVEGEGLVVLGSDVVDSVKEEPRWVGMANEDGEGRRRDYGVPVFADGGSERRVRMEKIFWS